MVNHVYKIDPDNSPHYDFQPDSKHDVAWHLLAHGSDDVRLLCSYLAIGAAGDIEVIGKTTERGGITCKECLSFVKAMKKVKL